MILRGRARPSARATPGTAGAPFSGMEPIDPIEDPEPSQPHRQPRERAGVLDRVVIGAAYLVQWVRSRLSSKHAGRS